ncbi:MAG: hypothetical protein HFG54_15515 [Lachnospiraceae bacterium]|jgi:thymidylate kinase|nr:hypothetical protein [Lachnospiraceae bacterium]
MVIEYLGISGVGKTTLAEKDYTKLLQGGKCVYWYSKDLYKNRGWLIRNIIKAGHVLLYSVNHLKWVIEYRDFLDAHIPNKKDTYTLLFNGIFLKKMLSFNKNPDDIYLFDEGALQYLWAIYLRSKQEMNMQDILNIKRIFGLPNKVKVLYASADTIERRLLSRNEFTQILKTSNLHTRIEYEQKKINQLLFLLKRENVEIEIVNNE